MSFVRAGMAVLGVKKGRKGGGGKGFYVASKALKIAVKEAPSADGSFDAVGRTVIELLRCFTELNATTGLKPLGVVLIDTVPMPVDVVSRQQGFSLFEEWAAAAPVVVQPTSDELSGDGNSAEPSSTPAEATDAVDAGGTESTDGNGGSGSDGEDTSSNDAMDAAIVVKLCKKYDFGALEEPLTAIQRETLLRYVNSLWHSSGHGKALAIEVSFALRGELLDASMVVPMLLKTKKIGELELYAESIEAQTAIINLAVDLEETRFADKLSSKWGLRKSFPGLHEKAREEQLSKLVAQGKVHQALGLCGVKLREKIFLVQELVRIGRYALAREIRQDGQVLEELVAIPDGDDKVGADGDFLSLEVPAAHVHWVATAEELTKMHSVLQADAAARLTKASENDDSSLLAVVGLDVEWKPVWTRGAAQRPASLLQIANRTDVFLVDLIAAASTPDSRAALNQAIAELFQTKNIIKLGYGLGGDLDKLRQSYPSSPCFEQPCSPVVDGVAFLKMNRIPFAPKGGPGLSEVCRLLLGAKLDKSCQCSNWEQRPLSRPQIEYAANDAHSLVRCFDAAVAKAGPVMAKKEVGLLLARDRGRATEMQRKLQQRRKSQNVAIASAELELDEGSGGAEVVDGGSDDVGAEAAETEADAEPKPGTEPLTTAAVIGAVITTRFLPEELLVLTEDESPTAAAAAASLGVDLGCIGKSIAFFAGNIPVVCVLPGNRTIRIKKLSQVMRCSRKKVKLATQIECVQIFGYAPGSMPPCGHRTPCRVLVDDSCFSSGSEEKIYLGGGSVTSHLLLNKEQLLAVSNGEIASVAAPLFDGDAEEGGSTADTSAAADGGKRSVGLPKFLVTPELSRLMRWMRVIGIDCRTPTAALTAANAPTNDIFDEVIAEADKSGRVLVSMNGKFAGRRGAEACFFLSSQKPEEQFQEVIQHFGIEWDDKRFLTICSKCGSQGFHGPMPLAEVQAAGSMDIPERVQKFVKEYWICRNDDCKQVYWVGPKYADASAKFRKLFKKNFDEKE